MKTSRLLLNFALLSCSTLVGVLAIEGFLRLRHQQELKDVLIPEEGNAGDLTPPYETPGLSYGSQANFATMVYDPVVTYRPKAPNVGRGYRINGQGFRYGEDLKETKAAGEVRVFVLGGSFAFGAGCPDGHTFFNVMEAELRKRFPHNTVRVLSAGVGAYQSLQEYLYFVSTVAIYQPDLVVFVSGWNDIYFGSRGRSPFSGNDTMNFGEAIEGCIRGDFLERTPDTNAFLNKSRPPRWDDYILKLHFLVDEARFHSAALSTTATNEMNLPVVPAARVMQELMVLQKSVHDFAAGRGIEVLYVLQPDLYSTRKHLHPYERKLLDDYRARYPKNQPYFVDRYARFRESMPPFFQGVGIAFADSDEELKGASAEDCFFVDHVHFGDRGQRWFGNFLARLTAPTLEKRLATTLATGPPRRSSSGPES